MVKLRGPCLSLDAAGSIGQALTFSTWRNRPYAKHYATPANPRSPAQTGWRAMVGFLQRYWSLLTTPQQATWESLAEQSNTSPYNAFTRYNLIRWRHFHYPTKTYPATELLDYGNVGVWSFTTTLPRAIQQTLRFSAEYDNWGYVLFRSTSTGFTPAPANAVYIFPIEDAANHYYLDAPLEPGTYYYRLARFSDDAKAYLSASQQSGIAL